MNLTRSYQFLKVLLHISTLVKTRLGASLHCVFASLPRSVASLVITANTITAEFAPTLIRLYEQMPAPKAVMTLGACSATKRSTFCPGDTLIPVDVYLAECPLRSQTLLEAIAQL